MNIRALEIAGEQVYEKWYKKLTATSPFFNRNYKKRCRAIASRKATNRMYLIDKSERRSCELLERVRRETNEK